MLAMCAWHLWLADWLELYALEDGAVCAGAPLVGWPELRWCRPEGPRALHAEGVLPGQLKWVQARGSQVLGEELKQV